VDPRAQGIGAGKANSCKGAEDTARAARFELMELTVAAKNDQAVRFFTWVVDCKEKFTSTALWQGG